MGELREPGPGQPEGPGPGPKPMAAHMPLDLAGDRAVGIVAAVASLVAKGFAEVRGLWKQMADNRKLPVRAYEDISLLQRTDGETLYPYWTSVARSKKGRRTSLDMQNRIKSIVAARVPEEDQSESEILITNWERHVVCRHGRCGASFW